MKKWKVFIFVAVLAVILTACSSFQKVAPFAQTTPAVGPVAVDNKLGHADVRVGSDLSFDLEVYTDTKPPTLIYKGNITIPPAGSEYIRKTKNYPSDIPILRLFGLEKPRVSIHWVNVSLQGNRHICGEIKPTLFSQDAIFSNWELVGETLKVYYQCPK